MMNCCAGSGSKGKGNLDTVELRHSSGAFAEIYLLGATLCKYCTNDGVNHIFVSPGAIFDGKKAIRGGVPIVFPQFGQPDKSMPQHGFARSSIWTVKEVKDAPEESRAVLTLSDTSETQETWPRAFLLEYTVSLTAANLRMTLRVTNTGDKPFEFHSLLHSYFKVPDIAKTVVRGLQGRSYIDKVANGEKRQEEASEIELPSFTDRVYMSSVADRSVVSIASRNGRDIYVVTNHARIDGRNKPCDVVVWNPYEKASPADLPVPAYKDFVCVEPGLVSAMQSLAPKASAELSQIVVVKSASSFGAGGLDIVVLRHASGATAQIYLLGATLTSYKSPNGQEQIFLSPGAIFDGKKAIRGGVPLVFPQFGQPDKSMPQHGFARSSMWVLKELKDYADESVAVLTLSDSEATREKWPHAFSLEYEVSLRAAHLKMTLRITNTGDRAFKFHGLLHTYLRIPEIGDVAIHGLQGRKFVDKVKGGAIAEEKDPAVCVPSFTDRIYMSDVAEAKEVSVRQKSGAALFDVKNEALLDGAVQPCDIVLWNPYEEASPGDLPVPSFRNFVCVEPGLVKEFQELAPRTTVELSQKLSEPELTKSKSRSQVHHYQR